MNALLYGWRSVKAEESRNTSERGPRPPRKRYLGGVLRLVVGGSCSREVSRQYCFESEGHESSTCDPMCVFHDYPIESDFVQGTLA